MASAQKFLFDTSFDSPGGSAGGEAKQQHSPITPAAPTFSRADIDAAAAKARVDGHAAGIAEALQQREHQIGQALAGIAQRLATLLTDKLAAQRENERGTIELTRAIAVKLFPALVRKGALAEIEAIVVKCMHDTIGEPRLVLRVSDAMFEAAQRRIAPLVTGNGYPGKLIILVDETIGESDCRVEWADGGAERDTARSWREIDAAIARAIGTLDETDETNPQVRATATEEI